MICPACDSNDCGFIVSAGPWDAPTHWYRCFTCWKWTTGVWPVCVDFSEETQTTYCPACNASCNDTVALDSHKRYCEPVKSPGGVVSR